MYVNPDRELLHASQAIRSIIEEVVVDGRKSVRIHTSWQLENGRVLLYEYSPANCPASNFSVYECLEDYNELCRQLELL
ncbi:hypothetical protein JOC55_003223 [Paenibacillus sacheonensis]|nr:hypothetical protein [Paenibacillus sacheonensis]